MKKLITSVFNILILNSTGFAQYVWTQKTSMPIARYIGCGFTIGTKSYIGSGYNSNPTALGDLWEYDQISDTWTQKASTTTRSSASAFVIDGKGYVGLGARSSTFLTDFYQYDPVTNIWTQKASLPAQGRFGAASFSIGNEGYVVCGNFGSANGPYTNEVFGYNAITNTWSAKAAFPGISRYGGRGESINNLGYVFGGINGSGTSSSDFFSDLWEYNPSLNSWLQKSDIPGLGRQYPSVFILNDKFVAGAGVHFTGFLSDFYSFDPILNVWNTLPSLPSGEARWAAVGFSNGIDGYIVSGNLSLNNPIVITNTLWKLSNTTSLTSELVMPEDILTYPNPCTQILSVDLKNTKPDNIYLSDINGKRVPDNHRLKNVNNSIVTYNVDALPSGIYFVNMNINGQHLVRQIVKD